MHPKSAQAVKSLIKPYVKRILLKTHPDYFSHDAAKKKINQMSFQSLQNVLNPILQGKQAERKSAGADENVKLDFFVKDERNRASSRVEHRLPVSAPTSALDMWTTTASILELCRKIGIQVMPSDIDAAQSMIDTLTKQHSELTRSRAPAPSLTQIFADELYHSPLAQHRTNMGDSNSKLQLESNELLYFQPHITDKAKDSMQKNLQMALPKLHPSRWWGKIPLLCVEDETDVEGIDVSGIIVFTSKMTTEGMIL